MKQDSRPDASLPWTLQLIASVGIAEISAAVSGGFGEPMTNMFIGRFWIVRASSTTRMRSLAASSALVNAASCTSVVYGPSVLRSYGVCSSTGSPMGQRRAGDRRRIRLRRMSRAEARADAPLEPLAQLVARLGERRLVGVDRALWLPDADDHPCARRHVAAFTGVRSIW